MNKSEIILDYLYPSKEIREEIRNYNKTLLRKIIRQIIGFGSFGSLIIVFGLVYENFLSYLLTNVLTIVLVIVYFVLLIKEFKVIKKIDRRQLEIIKNENLIISLRVTESRNKFNKIIASIIISIFLIPLLISIYMFIKGLIRSDYIDNPIYIFYASLFVFVLPIISMFFVASVLHSNKIYKYIIRNRGIHEIKK